MDWNKNINQQDARRLSKIFSKEFFIPYCEVYYVDRLERNRYAEYIFLMPPHMLLRSDLRNPIGMLVHELTHHLQYYGYYEKSDSEHGYYYQLAKRKMIKWCRENISAKANWKLPLKANPCDIDMVTFRL